MSAPDLRVGSRRCGIARNWHPPQKAAARPISLLSISLNPVLRSGQQKLHGVPANKTVGQRMKIGISIVTAALAAALVIVGILSLSAGSVGGFLSILPAALLIAVLYVAVVGSILHLLLRRMKKESHIAYAIAGGVAGICYLLVPMVLFGGSARLTEDFVSLVPFGLTLVGAGSVAGIVFRLCIGSHQKKSKPARTPEPPVRSGHGRS